MTWNYPDGFDPSCLDPKLDLEADSDELAKQILENEGQTAVCTLFDAVEYLYDFFNNSPIPPAFLEEFAQKTNQKNQQPSVLTSRRQNYDRPNRQLKFHHCSD